MRVQKRTIKDGEEHDEWQSIGEGNDLTYCKLHARQHEHVNASLVIPTRPTGMLGRSLFASVSISLPSTSNMSRIIAAAFHALAAGTMLWGFNSLHTTILDSWIRNQTGGHFQFLTIQGSVHVYMTAARKN